jgi:tetratricopeptide (TPR) repeat protein
LAQCQSAPDPLADARRAIDGGAYVEAAASIKSYLATNPASADAHFLLAYVLFREQKPKESLAEFTAGAKYRRPKTDELKAVASDYVLLGDYADADKWFSAVTEESPSDADAWYLLGRAKYSESRYDEAIPSFERAIRLRPWYVEAENNLGLSWRELNEKEKARAAFRNATEWQGNHPSDPQPFLNLGTLLADEDKLDEALPYLRQAATLAPGNPKVHDELAHVYEAQNDLPHAQSELEKAIAIAPNASELHFKLGRIYRREGNREESLREFGICDKLNGTHSSVQTPNPPSQASPH